MRMERILIVDDNKDTQFLLGEILKREGYKTIIVGDGESAIKTVKTSAPDLVLLDIKLPGMDGIEVLEEIRKIDKDLIVIMLTAFGDVKGAVTAIKLGAFDYITKPFYNEDLVLKIKKAIETQCLSREVESLRKRLGEKNAIQEIIGESPKTKQVLGYVNIIAPTNLTVIIQGESGTGKELIAQMIHRKSLRKDKPFVAVDCGAIPKEMAESELFGYEKGAFTGAYERKEGKFEQANGGTLFLDEITNLPDSIQMKFLRVIQERKLQHLGGLKDIKIDVRIIAATNTNFSEAVTAGKFREDLFHRLNEFCISLPPLRERKEDIPILAKYFLDKANLELNKNIKGFSAGAMKFLLNYHWSGNVRELKNVIRRSVLLTDAKYISLNNLFLDIAASESASDPKGILNSSASLREKIREFERVLIQGALEKSGGNKIRATEVLQINRKALYRKMKGLGLG